MALEALDNEIINLTNSSELESPTSAPLSPTETKTEAVASAIIDELEGLNPGPNGWDPAKEAVNKCAEIEKDTVGKIKAKEKEANAIIDSIDLLLSLSKELSSLDAEKPELNDKIKEKIQNLKDKGIDLFDLDKNKELSKENLAGLKAGISSHIDMQRTKIQQIFTKMQTLVQNLASINDTTKKILSEQADLIRKVLERSIKR